MNDLMTLSIIEDVDINHISDQIKKIRSFQSVVQGNLKSDHDYGVIPGCKKPTLLKPGAEKILILFALTSEYEIISQEEDYKNGFFQYMIKCVLSKNGYKITEGVGSCNSYETKYRWRWVQEKDLPPGSDKSMLASRINRYNSKEYRIDNDEICSIANTILKMAKKRAQVDAVLTVASLSEIFTQDIEDMPSLDNGHASNSRAADPPRKQTSNEASQAQINAIKGYSAQIGFANEEELFMYFNVNSLEVQNYGEFTKETASKAIGLLKAEIDERKKTA